MEIHFSFCLHYFPEKAYQLFQKLCANNGVKNAGAYKPHHEHNQAQKQADHRTRFTCFGCRRFFRLFIFCTKNNSNDRKHSSTKTQSKSKYAKNN